MISNITNRTDPNSVKSRVFVGNLNTVQMTKTELENIFSRYGPIIGISVHKGYAFVQYASEVSARAAVMGEDAKQYYNMILDVTIASEPKNRKRGRSNVNPGMSSCPGLSELTLQAQAISSSHHHHPMLSLHHSLGGGSPGTVVEGIMGRPNLSQFAAAAGCVLGNSATGLAGQSAAPGSTHAVYHSRSKSSRATGVGGGLHGPSSASSSSASSFSLSGAKRTRLETTSHASVAHSSGSSLGARSHNLVPLVTPTGYDQTASRSSRQSKSGLNHRAPQPRHQHKATTGCPVAPTPIAGSPRSEAGDTPTGRGKSEGAEGRSRTEDADSGQTRVETRKDNQLDGVSAEEVSTASGRTAAEDILICGTCRLLFDHVDELISHKMAGCSLGSSTCQVCRCRSAGEPSSLECAYCGHIFTRAWSLMLHCHSRHGVTVYALSSSGARPSAPVHSDLDPDAPAGGSDLDGEVNGSLTGVLADYHQVAGNDSEDSEGLDGVELNLSAPTQDEVSVLPPPEDVDEGSAQEEGIPLDHGDRDGEDLEAVVVGEEVETSPVEEAS